MARKARSDNTISKWRGELRQYKDRAFAGRGRAYTDEARANELERMVGRLTMENDFLKAFAEAGNRDSDNAEHHRRYFGANVHFCFHAWAGQNCRKRT